MPASKAALAALLVAASACQSETAAERGAELFRDPSLSTSPFNQIACSTCHVVDPAAGTFVAGRFDSGANLAGVTARPSFWGGYETRLLDAVNVCLQNFMGGAPLVPDTDEAKFLYAHLSMPGGAQSAVKVTLVRDVTGLRSNVADATRGAVVYAAACARCHGPPHGPAVVRGASTIPEASLNAFPTQAREAVVEKVRHGKFFGIGGLMPPYPLEAMSDESLADLLAFLGL